MSRRIKSWLSQAALVIRIPLWRNGRFCRGTVDALTFHAVHEMTAEALLTVLMRVRIVQHVRAEGREEGRQEGRIEGIGIGEIRMLVQLVREGDLPLERAAAKAKMTVEQFKETMENTPLQAV